MNAPQALALWNGVPGIMSFSMTMGQGIEPSFASMTIPPLRGQAPLDGDLTMIWAGQSIVFRRCRIESIEVNRGPGGEELWTLRIMDRRWWWRKCQRISGFYNVRRGDGDEVDPDTLKRPRELAKLCLEAMLEQRPDVSALPDATFPEITWDYANPAQALSDLCESLGCRVVLTLQDRVRIVRVGEGLELPLRPLMDGGATFDPPDPPGKLVIVTNRTQWQGDFPLEAVGLELDHTVVPVDELSYCPKVGGAKTWRFSDIDHFQDVSDPKARAFAQTSVYRWFRIKSPVTLPGLKDKLDVWRILPLLDRQVERQKMADGRKQALPPWVFGRWWPGFEDGEPATDAFEPDLRNKPKGLYTHGFDLDTETGIVKASRPLIRMTLDTRVATGRLVFPPELWLRIAVNVRDEDTRGWRRMEFERKPGGYIANRATSQFVLKDDLQPQFFHDWKTKRDVANVREIEKAANEYLDGELRKYLPDQSGTITYPGLVRWECDGAIQQVAWSIDDGYPTTRVSRNREELTGTTSYAERRLFARIDRALKEAERPARAKADDGKRMRG